MSKLKMQPGTFHLSHNLIHDDYEKISGRARFVYSYLYRCANQYNATFPSYAKIRKICGIGSDSTVRDAIKELEDNGLIEVTRRYTADGRKRSNIYNVLLPGPENQPEMKPIMDVLNSAPMDAVKIAQAAHYLRQLFSTETKPVTNETEFVTDGATNTTDTAPAAVSSETHEPKAEPINAETTTTEPLDDSELKKRGHHGFVLMTDTQYERLVNDYGINAVLDYIDQLDSRIASDGGPSKSKYLGIYPVVRRWLRKGYEERMKRTSWDLDDTLRNLTGKNPTETFDDPKLAPF